MTTQVALIQGIEGWFNIKKSTNVIHHTKKEKSHGHLNDTEKAFDKI